MAKAEETTVKAVAHSTSSGQAAATEAKPAAQPAAKGPDKGGFYWGTGRRKTSVARVRIKPGDGKLVINKRQLVEYFKTDQDRSAVMGPLQATKTEKSFDIYANVRGGGTTGQTGATVLGIARALKNYDPSLAQVLRDGGFLTRDPRMVERKKPGQSGARRRFQFSKR
jgi:small subunit ribosomal protein S9